MKLDVLDGRQGDRQFQEESPRWKDASKGQVCREWEAKMANEDHARFPRLRIGGPLNEQVMDMRGTGQTAGDDQVSEEQRSALADVSPSDADSGGEKKNRKKKVSEAR